MPHKPILSQNSLGRFDRVQIDPGQQGVLFAKNQFRRVIEPGNSISLRERAEGGLMLHIVDCTPHEASWRVDLPTHDLKDWFPVTISMTYQVQDSQRIVEEHVIDTETLVARSLEPLLRERTRQYRLNEYAQAENSLKEIVTNNRFAECGLGLHKVDIVMNFNQEHLDRIEGLNKWARAMRVPQQAEYSSALPTMEATYKFQINGILNFKVTSQKNLPTDTLEEAEAWLWRQVRAKLRSVSRKYAVNQIKEAELALQEALEEEVFNDHGLEIVSAQIEIELDEEAHKHAKELEAIRAQKHLENEQAELEKTREQRKHFEEMEALRRKHAAEQEAVRVQVALEEEQAKLDELRNQRKYEEELERLRQKHIEELESLRQQTDLVTARANLEKKQQEEQAQLEELRQETKHVEDLETLRRKYAAELETVRQQTDLTAAQADLEKIQQQIKYVEELGHLRKKLSLEVKRGELEDLLQERQLGQKRRAIDFYSGYVEKGHWQLLAMALASNEMDASSVISFLDAQQKEKLRLQVEILKDMIREDSLPEYISEKFTVSLLDDLATRISSEGAMPALEMAEELKALTDHKEKSEEQDSSKNLEGLEAESQKSEKSSGIAEEENDDYENDAELPSASDQNEAETTESPDETKKEDDAKADDENRETT